MEIHLYEPGKPEGQRAVDRKLTLEKGAVTIGGAGADVTVPAAPAGAAAEIAVEGGAARLRRLGAAPVSAGGRDIPPGGDAALGQETLLSIGGIEIVWRVTGGAAAADSGERPSLMARELLKQVFSALGVPEGETPALLVSDLEERPVKRFDLVASENEVTIGRAAENKLSIHHASVAKTHARVVRDALGWMVFEEGRAGLEVNGGRIAGQQRLKSGDRIRVGDFIVKFVDPRQTAEELKSVPKAPSSSSAERAPAAAAGPAEAARHAPRAPEARSAPASASGSGSGSGTKAAAAAAKGMGAGMWVIIGFGLIMLLGAVGLILLIMVG